MGRRFDPDRAHFDRIEPHWNTYTYVMSNAQKWLIARGAFYIGALHGSNLQDLGTRRFAVFKASAFLQLLQQI